MRLEEFWQDSVEKRPTVERLLPTPEHTTQNLHILVTLK
jgi:hypothetical protein